MTRNLFALLAGLLLACQVQAIQISSAGDSWTVDWLVSAASKPGLSSDLTATSSWSVSAFDQNQIILDISITNTTTLTPLLTNADITAFGFGIDPNATASIYSAGTTFDMVGTGSGPQQTFPGGFKGIDICIFATNGCSGGSVNGALAAGTSDTLQLMLTGNFMTSTGLAANLVYFPLKFQTSLGSYEPAGCINGNGCTSVPEPSVLALLGTGLLLIVFTHSRNRQSKTIQA